MSSKPASELKPTHNSADASDLIQAWSGCASKKRKLIAILEVGTQEESTVILGEYTKQHPPIGFTIEYAPTINPSVDSHITLTNKDELTQYELALCLASQGPQTVSAEVWEIQEA